ncbi:SUMF1/EgtB/PvdO family nonheme iron enzyme [Marinobacterium sp. D7]|uniref:SUMF1/EgtB/PvdO family nonheme iron enzyme n=1 Tax=Marinobacterium ramblicola TaxID=2849041 RepID=UPI001C2CCCD0|nr:SUMF1/EgtB/PvdO family nonheme iron enzyme [Marinobacterium ramblicola]MBV1790085.1 SUMF1/EgtB/PvdO family nonheme iron enzyme [Marinobacterium ramblicola]
MDSTAKPPLDALKPELVIGPEHHRFRLKTLLSPHMLGQLWQAEDISTTQPTPVTLLFLSTQLLGQSGFVDKLRDVLNRNRTIKDPLAARCYGLFSWRGMFFCSWEALDDLTLAQMLADGRAYKMKEPQKRGLIIQVGKALQAHLKQFNQPHATLAPEFIYLNRSNGVRLMGYQWRALLEPVVPLLESPPGYLDWQSADAFHPNLLDASEDVFALACLVYELYAGKPPFSAEDGEQGRREKELKAPSGLSKEQWKVLHSALAYETEQRPDSPLALVRQLYADKADEAKVQAEKPADSTPELPAEIDTQPASRPSRRWALPTGWTRPVLSGLALFAGGVALGYWLAYSETTATTSAPTSDTQPLTQLRQENLILKERLQQLQGAVTATDSANSMPAESSTRAEIPPAAVTTGDVTTGEAMREAEKPADNLSAFRDQWAPDRFAPQMVVIPKGRFRMGDLHGAGDDNEYPVHQVIIGRAFALSRFEVTFAEYDQFAEDTGRPLPDDQGWGRGNQPVINVSWQDAKDYTRWLAEQSGQPYRLPTEAEWEYVARAGTETKYWWSDELSDGIAVCDGCGTQWDGQRPAPVGSFPANPWGIHDLNGNVDEWVEDCYSGTYDGAPTDGSASTGSNCSHRVMRGGSWFEIPRLIRSASRYRHPANTSRNSWGFRVALDLPNSE